MYVSVSPFSDGCSRKVAYCYVCRGLNGIGKCCSTFWPAIPLALALPTLEVGLQRESGSPYYCTQYYTGSTHNEKLNHELICTIGGLGLKNMRKYVLRVSLTFILFAWFCISLKSTLKSLLCINSIKKIKCISKWWLPFFADIPTELLWWILCISNKNFWLLVKNI